MSDFNRDQEEAMCVDPYCTKHGGKPLPPKLPEGWEPLRNAKGEIVIAIQGDMLWVLATGKLLTIPKAVISGEVMLQLKELENREL